MQYDTEKITLGVCKTGFEGCEEQSIDLDFNLPDYCPDIQKILKCHIYPKVTMENIVGETLTVDGFYLVKLVYLDPDKMSIRCCEHTSPFSVQFNLKENMEGAIVFAKSKVEYMNCRAINQRRLDIHGAFSICVKVKKREERNIIAEIIGENIEQKKDTALVDDLLALSQIQFSVEENIKLDENDLPIELILRSDINVTVNDCKTLTNKVIVNATARLTLFYVNNLETGSTAVLYYDIPISQILDINGVEERAFCNIKLEEVNHDLQLKLDSDTNNNFLKVDARFIFSGLIYEKKEIEYLEDAYSIDFETQKELEENDIQVVQNSVNLDYIDTQEVELRVLKIDRVLDICNEFVEVDAKQSEGGGISLNGKYNLCIIATEEDGDPIYLEKVYSFNYLLNPKEKNGEVYSDLVPTVTSIEYQIKNDNTLEVETKLNFKGPIYKKITLKSLKELTVDEDIPIIKDNDAALKIYYAEKNESLWDIARRYNALVKDIKLENEIEEDVLGESRMLLIPI